MKTYYIDGIKRKSFYIYEILVRFYKNSTLSDDIARIERTTGVILPENFMRENYTHPANGKTYNEKILYFKSLVEAKKVLKIFSNYIELKKNNYRII